MDEEQKILFPEEKQKILSHEEKQELLEIYRISEKRRMHYDTLGWAIGAVLVPLAIYAYRFALVELRAKTEYIVPVGVIGIVLFLFWHMCYDRLGKFASLAIESINKIENILQLSVKPQHHFHKTIFHHWRFGGLQRVRRLLFFLVPPMDILFDLFFHLDDHMDDKTERDGIRSLGSFIHRGTGIHIVLS